MISFFDGLIMGLGYTIVLMAVAFVRELLGFGTLFGINVLGEGWINWTLMIMPPGAFFMIGIVIWVTSNLFPKEDQEKGGAKA